MHFHLAASLIVLIKCIEFIVKVSKSCIEFIVKVSKSCIEFIIKVSKKERDIPHTRPPKYHEARALATIDTTNPLYCFLSLIKDG
jgi:hypothetical protein